MTLLMMAVGSANSSSSSYFYSTHPYAVLPYQHPFQAQSQYQVPENVLNQESPLSMMVSFFFNSQKFQLK